jgi:pimeloyl-ACP methyl ester carboxylesterase
MARAIRILAAGLAVAGVVGVWLLTPRTPPAYDPPRPLAEPFEAFYARRLALAAAEGVPPDNRELLVRRAPGRSPLAILYIHGFGAARAEGEAVVDEVAETLSANVYYLRLPGHGGGEEAQARAVATDYLDVVDEAVVRARDLGERLVVIGSSTGGLLGAWVAARHPQQVDALVMASPLFGFRDRLAFLAGTPTGIALVERLLGPERDASWRNDPEGRKQPGYEQHWIMSQRWSAFFALHELYRRCATPEMLARVRAPALLLYTDRETVLDVASMKAAFAQLGGVAQSRLVAIDDGNHILLSKYVRTDKPAITRAITGFLRQALGADHDS